ncbi:MAG: BON domain-containing protein [Steroidobacteraceae bacterium]
MKSAVATLLAFPVLILGAQVATAQTTSPEHDSTTTSSTQATPSDNTKSNRQDPSNTKETADKQQNNAPDLDLARRIRRSVMADKSLSTYGHNVKIVAVNGTVTLNGVVRSADEKAQIGAKSASIAGKEHVVNDLKVAAAK